MDRLKALTNKLEEKIAEKKANSHPSSVEAVNKAKEVPKYAEPVKEKSDAQELVEQELVARKPIDQKPVEQKKVVQKSDPVSTPSAPKTKSSKILPVKNDHAGWVRENNINRVRILYEELGIFEKTPDFSIIFSYKAMNLSGIGLKESDFGVLREKKYIQIIAITYEPDANGKKKAKNISQGYFGKAEAIDPDLKNKIIEFVLRWRYEKAFQNVAHYKGLISKLDKPKKLS